MAGLAGRDAAGAAAGLGGRMSGAAAAASCLRPKLPKPDTAGLLGTDPEPTGTTACPGKSGLRPCNGNSMQTVIVGGREASQAKLVLVLV